MLDPLPESFRATTEALHTLAEHVIAPARYRSDGHIGLVATPGGFGTPHFGDGERIRVEGSELVHERPGKTLRVPISTLADAAQFLGTPLGALTEVYNPATACLPDTSLDVDVESARALAAWLEFASGLLHELGERYGGQSSSAIQLWPEHFDLARELGDRDAATRANYGASPGDGNIREPYLYVGAWDESRRTGRLGSHPFGAALPYDDLRAAPDARTAARDFYFECAELLLGAP